MPATEMENHAPAHTGASNTGACVNRKQASTGVGGTKADVPVASRLVASGSVGLDGDKLGGAVCQGRS